MNSSKFFTVLWRTLRSSTQFADTSTQSVDASPCSTLEISRASRQGLLVHVAARALPVLLEEYFAPASHAVSLVAPGGRQGCHSGQSWELELSSCPGRPGAAAEQAEPWSKRGRGGTERQGEW